MYSYWVRDAGMGMAARFGKVTSPLRAAAEQIEPFGHVSPDNESNRSAAARWLKVLWADNLLGVAMNVGTVLLTTLLAFAILTPDRVKAIPGGWDLVSFQADFFRSSWGPAAGLLLLLAASLFLADTWLGAADGVSRMAADMICANFPAARSRPFRFYYYCSVAALTLISVFTVAVKSPGSLILLSGVCNLLAMAVYVPALVYLGAVYLPRRAPAWTRPPWWETAGLVAAGVAYIGLGVWYLRIVAQR